MRKQIIIIMSILTAILSGCSPNKDTQPTDTAQLVLNIPKKTKPEHIETYKVLFEKCRAETIKEEACIEYSLFQSITDPTEFHLFERWTSEQGQIEHTRTKHFKEYMEASKDIFEQPSGEMIKSYTRAQEISKPDTN